MTRVGWVPGGHILHPLRREYIAPPPPVVARNPNPRKAGRAPRPETLAGTAGVQCMEIPYKQVSCTTLSLRFTGPPVPLTARMHSTPWMQVTV
eukprot:9249195-Pyramimonas_sp.AAC.1